MATLDPSKVFSQVDQMPEPDMLVRSMDDTGRWPAVRELRAHSADWLRVGPGASVLDVGCGPGEVVIAFARDTGPSGRAVGIDASTTMIEAARRRAGELGVTAEFYLGDAQALAFPDGTFDACRSERTFQWLSDPERALAEMVRVTRPGGAVSVIDSDWATFSIDHPDRAVNDKIVSFVANGRGDQTTVGRRLRGLFRRAGLEEVTVTARAALFTDWDVDTEPAPPGLMPMAPFLDRLAETGVVTPDEAVSWLAQFMQLARDGELCGSLTIYAVCGRKSAPPAPTA